MVQSLLLFCMCMNFWQQRSSMKSIASLEDTLNHAFSMTDLGLLSQFLGLELSQLDLGIKLHQSKYYLYLLKVFKMKYFNPSKTSFLLWVNHEEANSTPLVNNTLYRKLVAFLLYLTHTWHDIYYAVSV